MKPRSKEIGEKELRLGKGQKELRDNNLKRSITFRFNHGKFTLLPVPSVIFLVMLVALLGLGTWQVKRLHWKENLIALVNQRINAAPLDVAAINFDKTSEYQPAKAVGVFQNEHEFFLATVSLEGEGGYHVLAPLKLKNGKYLLVDRGWIPYHKKDKQDYARPKDKVTVTGILREPHQHWVQAENQPSQNQWYSIDLMAMAAAAKVPGFLPYYLEANARPNPGGYPMGGQTRVTFINNHLVYAITWYALALALIIIYGLSGYRKVS